jgi:hypothetical protein
MRQPLHRELATNGWQKLSLKEQLGNIGSEVSRAARWQGRNEARFQSAVDRALDLFDLTLADTRWSGRRWEIARAREVFCDAFYGGFLYGTSFSGLQKYFDQFALAAGR